MSLIIPSILALFRASRCVLPIPQSDVTVAIEVVDLPTTILTPDQMRRVVFAEDFQGLLELILFDVAMGCKVATGGTSLDKVPAGQKGQGAGEVIVGEMDLG